jgi:PAS domain S-box-containing protein
MTIGKKLFGWFLVPIILAVILGIITFVNSRKIDKNINVLIEEDWKRADSNMELRIGIGLLGSSVAILAEALAYEDIEYKEKTKEAIREADKLAKYGKAKFIDGFEKLVELEKQVPDVLKLRYSTVEVKHRYNTMIDALDKMKKAFLAGDTITALSIKEKEFDPHLLELQVTLLEEAEEFADAIVEASKTKITKITAASVTTGIALTIVIAIVGLVFSLIICRVISKPIIKLKNATIEIGKGKFDKTIEIKTRDEIGQLADSFNKMTINLKKFGDNIKQSEERYRDLIENCSEMIYQTDKKRFFVGTNKTMLNKLGFPSEELLGMRMDNIVPDNEREKVIKHIQKVVENGCDSIETTFLTKKREVLYVEINATAMYDSKGNFIQTRAFVRDITERKKVEAAEKHEKDLKLLSSQIISVQEKERRRISRELHDETGQSLTAMKINLELLENEIPENTSKIRQRLTDTKQLLTHTLKEVRSLSFELRPSLLDDFGILAAIRGYSKNFSERSNINVEVLGKNIVERFTPEIEILFYRCAQEALNNVAKHSDAKNVTIYIILNETELRMRIKDDGKGFDVRKHFEKNMSSSSIGLFGMRERASLVDGTLRIHSEKNKGTVLEILVPVKVSIRKNKYSIVNIS